MTTTYAITTTTRTIRPEWDTRPECERRDENGVYIQRPRIRGEYAVASDLQYMGIDATCPSRIDFKRKGKDRYAEPVESPYLPGYIFAAIPAHLFRDAMQVRGIGRNAMPIPAGEMEQFRRFMEKVDDMRAEADRIAQRRDIAAMHDFKANEPLELLSDAFRGQLVRFAGITQAASSPHPMIEWEAEMFGRVVTGTADPLNVRRAS